MNLRPELVIARAELKNRQFEVIRARNQLLPDLTFNMGYNIHALGTRLDGNGSLPPDTAGVSRPGQPIARTGGKPRSRRVSRGAPRALHRAAADHRPAR